ncbi:hypothetical protein WJX84_005399 [Apatococcus fuscideae]|uniref:Uncharacterized protein n=1 Tax=Apatococcus fuscideae TaxID=2026836 RepID=A0AAW1TAQ5_9CHLO
MRNPAAAGSPRVCPVHGSTRNPSTFPAAPGPGIGLLGAKLPQCSADFGQAAPLNLSPPYVSSAHRSFPASHQFPASDHGRVTPPLAVEIVGNLDFPAALRPPSHADRQPISPGGSARLQQPVPIMPIRGGSARPAIAGASGDLGDPHLFRVGEPIRGHSARPVVAGAQGDLTGPDLLRAAMPIRDHPILGSASGVPATLSSPATLLPPGINRTYGTHGKPPPASEAPACADSPARPSAAVPIGRPHLQLPEVSAIQSGAGTSESLAPLRARPIHLSEAEATRQNRGTLIPAPAGRGIQQEHAAHAHHAAQQGAHAYMLDASAFQNVLAKAQSILDAATATIAMQTRSLLESPAAGTSFYPGSQAQTQAQPVQQLDVEAAYEQRRLERDFASLKREYMVAQEAANRSEDLTSSIQLTLVNDVTLLGNSRSTVSKLISAYTQMLGLPQPDRSVAKAHNFQWQQRWVGASAMGAWYVVILCGGQGELTFDSTCPGTIGETYSLQSLMHEPRERCLQRLRRYSECILELIQAAGGDLASAAAVRAAEFAQEWQATAIAMTGRVARRFHVSQTTMLPDELDVATPKQRHFASVAACLGLTTVQKVTAIMKRNHFYVTLGGVLHAREKLLKQLEAAAVGITMTADCDIMECLGRPQPASQEAMSLLARVKLSMDHQRYLIRNFIYELNMEIMSPIQFAIFMARSLPYYFDCMATVNAMARELNYPSVAELLAMHHHEGTLH